MTPDDLARVAEIRARADAATEVLVAKRGADAIEIIGTDGRCIATCWTWDEGRTADAEFFAAARSDVPWLLDRLAAATERADKAEALHRPNEGGSEDHGWCRECGKGYPCPTSAALSSAEKQQ